VIGSYDNYFTGPLYHINIINLIYVEVCHKMFNGILK